MAYENQDSFEWKHTDDATLERMFYYFQKDIWQYKSWNVQNWYRGLYTKDGGIFLTCMDTINGCLLRTGTDADEWFYQYFLVLVVNKYGIRIGGEATYQERLGGSRHECSVSDNLKEYEGVIARMMEVYQDVRDETLEYPGELEKEAHDAKIKKYRAELNALAEASRRGNVPEMEDNKRYVVFQIPGLIVITRKGKPKPPFSRIKKFLMRFFT